MKLKRLVLQGYKTFANKTEFVFDEGITSIVGPNGSGKSNIADALRWVLGEQSYGTLRGKRTVDMIFAGSKERARAGMASAILTLDNSDGWLPIDYSEVEIGRRAHRSGENEYILNGQKVRLKDITDLLATSGLSQRTYTIIGQGLIDQALSLRSEERRALFEEAAGINHYKSRRATTLRNLQETQRNLQRVHDILAEIRPRLGSLKRQATRAQNYEQISRDLHHLLRVWYGYRWERVKGNLREARKTADSAEAQWQTSRRALRVEQENGDALRRKISRWQTTLTQREEAREVVRQKLERARRESAILRERQQAVTRQLADIEQDLPALVEQEEAAQRVLAEATTALETAQVGLKAQEGDLAQFNSSFQVQQVAIGKWRTTLSEAREAQRRGQNRVAQLEGQLAQLQERQQAELPAVDETEQKQAQETIEKQTAVYEAAKRKADEQREKREALTKARQELIRELKQLRRGVREVEGTLNKRRSQAAKQEARVDMLGGMRQKQVKGAGSEAVLGQFASFIEIPAKYENAVAAYLGEQLSTLAVPSEDALWALVRGNGGGSQQVAALDNLRGTRLVLNETSGSGVIGLACDVVTCREEKLRELLEVLLGQLVLVETDEAAYRLAQTLPPWGVALTPSGFAASGSGVVMTFAQNSQNSVLAREAAWRAARAVLKKVQGELAEVETAVSAQQKAIQAKQSEVDGQQSEEQRLGRLENESRQRATQAQRTLDRAKQQLAFMERQQANAATAAEREAARVAELEEALEKGRLDLTTQAEGVEQAEAELAALPIAEAQQQRLSLRQGIEAARTVLAGRQAVVDSRRSTLGQVSSQINRLKTRQKLLVEQQKGSALAEEEAAVQTLQGQQDRLDQEMKPLRVQLGEGRADLTTVEEKTAVLQKQAHDHETIYTQAKIQLTQRETQIENLQDRIREDIGLVALRFDEDQTGATPLPMSEVVEELPQVEELPEDIEDTIQRYRGQMQRLGAINPDAPAEYEETQERFDFLTQQIEDLNNTEAKLRQIIAELDELTSKAFGETVERVNVVFGETFTQLFGGGVAHLVLTDPDDLTISGVDIIAQLPGRRAQGLGLLSGGERSLTAAALIFSLLKVSPTPFCVMDEVDAALDEANINRFREALRELSLDTQFIVITHNRGTVQAAQTIYGISMGTDSVSQAISIRPEEYVKQEELLPQ